MDLFAILTVKQEKYRGKSELLKDYDGKSFAFQFDIVSERLLK